MSTALADYLEREGITDAAFAAKINRDRSIVNKLRRGVLKPTPEIALAIEEQTNGAVDAAHLNPAIAAARTKAA